MSKKICVSVGHGKSKTGGFDPGACYEGRREFNTAKEIAKYLAEYLRTAGFEVSLINCGADLYLTERIEKINAGNFDLAVEIHLNAGGGTGSEVYYPSGSENGRKAAGLISAYISEAFGIPDRGAKIKTGVLGNDYFAVVREAKPLALLVETVFIDSPDVKNVATAAGRDRCAKAVSEAISAYFAAKPSAPFRIKVACDELNVRSGPGSGHKINMTVKKGGVYTVVEKSGGWGRLKSGAGWIYLGGGLVEKAENRV